MRLFIVGVILVVSVLTGCDRPAGGQGTLRAVNHTSWAINSFSVNGVSGIDVINPHSGGGGGCCFGVSGKWQPGMTVKIDWETGAGYSMDFPGYENRDEYLKWREKIVSMNRQHSAVVPVPDYSGQETCGITVHFLPCNEIKVTTSCYGPDRPEYPIKEPLDMPEPQACRMPDGA